MPDEQMAQAVRSWYGLPAEIAVENNLWHLVRVAGLSLHHPPLVNLILRRGLPREERLYLSFLHEFGHLQTLPVAVLHRPTRAPIRHVEIIVPSQTLHIHRLHSRQSNKPSACSCAELWRVP